MEVRTLFSFHPSLQTSILRQRRSAMIESACAPVIDGLEVSAYTVPTDQPEADGTLAWDSTTLVLVEAHATDGTSGLGYSYTHAAAASLIESLLAEQVQDIEVTAVYRAQREMVRATRNLGRPGICACAISAVDIALWDLKARVFNQPLAEVLNRVKEAIPIYGSGGCRCCCTGDVSVSAMRTGAYSQSIRRSRLLFFHPVAYAFDKSLHSFLHRLLYRTLDEGFLYRRGNEHHSQICEAGGARIARFREAHQFQHHRFERYDIMESRPLGKTRWAIAEGYIPEESHGPEPEMVSHETVCMLNTSEDEAQVRILLYFSDREPAGPYRVTVPARRTRHVRFNELKDPEPVPKATEFASVIEADMPIVVQHTRLDSRQAENALLSTMAYAE